MDKKLLGNPNSKLATAYSILSLKKVMNSRRIVREMTIKVMIADGQKKWDFNLARASSLE